MRVFQGNAGLLSGNSSGQAALGTMFLMGGIVLFGAVTITILVSGFLSSTAGFESANRALSIASAGINDAMLRLNRDKDFSSVSPYTLPIDSYSAAVTVTQATPSAGHVTVLSVASINNYRRELRAVLTVSTSTGEVRPLTIELQ